MNSVDSNNIKSTDKTDIKADERNDESSYVSLLKFLNYVIIYIKIFGYINL